MSACVFERFVEINVPYAWYLKTVFFVGVISIRSHLSPSSEMI